MRVRLASWSISARLSLLFAVCSLAVLVGVGVFLYEVLERDIYRDEVSSLTAQVDAVRGILEMDPDLSGPASEGLRQEYADSSEADYGLRVMDDGGRVVFETPGFGALLGLVLRPASGWSASREIVVDRRRRDGRTYVVAAGASEIATRGGLLRVVLISYDGSHEEALLRDYRRAIFGVVLLGSVVSVVAGARIARNALRPLQEITQVTRLVRATQLEQRIGQRPWPRELVALAIAFDEMLARLALAVSGLSQFSADLAHELRTPLNNLIGEAEVTLSRERSDREYRETLESSLEECRRLATLTEELLFMARLERDGLSAERRPVEARRIADAVKAMYDSVAEEQGTAIVCEGSAGVTASPALLRRALINLVSNAIRHAQSKHISIAVTRVPSGAEIRVSDDGIGIAPEHLPRIFDRFYRVDSSRTQDSGGAGLGLAIVKSIADMHRGAVEVISDVGAGTSIALTIPDP